MKLLNASAAQQQTARYFEASETLRRARREYVTIGEYLQALDARQQAVDAVLNSVEADTVADEHFEQLAAGADEGVRVGDLRTAVTDRLLFDMGVVPAATNCGRLLVIGAAPPRGGRSCLPLYPSPVGCAGYRLWRMSGLTLEQYLGGTQRVNLLDKYPGPANGGKGDAFPMAHARERAAGVVAGRRLHGRTILMVGTAVTQAFGVTTKIVPPFEVRRADEWTGLTECRAWAWAPHPSGRCRAYNDAANVAALGETFATLMKELAR